MSRPPFPPFTLETALQKVQADVAITDDVAITEDERRIFGPRQASDRTEIPLR